ncbi:hypothetical protein B0H13DRAFT_760848 [Mycena leptocephala]|nr:hypothetical protein B0H13DRAFT_760848 [Mycena leptocephala]
MSCRRGNKIHEPLRQSLRFCDRLRGNRLDSCRPLWVPVRFRCSGKARSPTTLPRRLPRLKSIAILIWDACYQTRQCRTSIIGTGCSSKRIHGRLSGDNMAVDETAPALGFVHGSWTDRPYVTGNRGETVTRSTDDLLRPFFLDQANRLCTPQ